MYLCKELPKEVFIVRRIHGCIDPNLFKKIGSVHLYIFVVRDHRYLRAKFESMEFTDLCMLNTLAFILASTVVLEVTLASCFLIVQRTQKKYRLLLSVQKQNILKSN